MKTGSKSRGAGNARVFQVLGYVLVFLMLTCLAMTIGILIHTLVPGWHSVIVFGAMLLVVMVRMYTYRQVKVLTLFSREWALSLAAQWIVILLFTRLLLSYANGIDFFQEELSLFARGYLDRLLSPEFIICILLAMLAWYLAGQFLGLIDEIGFNQAAVLREDPVPIEQDVVPAHQRMLHLVFGLGIFLVVLAALTRMNLLPIVSAPGRIPKVEFNRFSGAESGVLLYFVFGLALLSLSRLMSLQTRWNHQRIPISSKNLARQWGIYSLLFLLGLAVIVSLLPAGDSFGFFSLIGIFFGFLFRVFLFIGAVISSLVLLLFSIPFLLLGKAPPLHYAPIAPTIPILPTAPVMPAANSALWALIRSILLWGGLAAIIFFAIKQRREILPAVRKSKILNWLALAWQWLYQNIEKTRGGLSNLISEGWQGLTSRLDGRRIPSPAAWINVRSLDPRRRIFFFYLAMIRRGGELDIARKPSQTPSEYAVILEQSLPPAEDDVDAITQAFVEARYSRHEISSQDVNRIKEAWGRIRRAFQDKSKRDKPRKN